MITLIFSLLGFIYFKIKRDHKNTKKIGRKHKMTPKFVLAPDSFKESMSAKEVCGAMEKGIRAVFPTAQIIKVPMADGGEGTMETLIEATQGRKITLNVTGPLPDQEVSASFGLLGDQKTAVIEMAQASGLEKLPPDQRNPLVTTTYGTGQLIKAALDLGVKKIVMALGGSATNDGGAGMAQALGVQLLDANHQPLKLGGGALKSLEKIALATLDPRIKTVEILIASDVSNPLCGPNGASFVFGPQKGATPQMVTVLDEALAHYANRIQKDCKISVKNQAGAGAAGGLGAGLLAFTPAKMVRGVDLVTGLLALDEKIKTTDFVFTGEGGIDAQTKFGKVPYGVSKIAQQYKKPCFALAGFIGEGSDVLYDEGITAIFGILEKAQSLNEALRSGKENVTRTTRAIASVLKSSTLFPKENAHH